MPKQSEGTNPALLDALGQADSVTTEGGSPEKASTTEGTPNSGSEESKHSDVAQQNKEKQIAVWTERVKNGEKSIDEIPHKWIQEAVQAKVGVDKPAPADNVKDSLSKEEIAALVAETMQGQLKAKEQAEKLKSLYADLSSMKLTESEKFDLIEQEQALRDKGLNEADALELAIKLSVRDSKRKPAPGLQAGYLGSAKRASLDPANVDTLMGASMKDVLKYQKSILEKRIVGRPQRNA